MSEKYPMVKKFYDDKLWDIDRVKNVVTAPIPWITKEEYQQITGFVYPATK
ncbi:MAG: XkdX family protein [Aminipila sp.]